MEEKKQQRIGQIIMACNIIKAENENMSKMPKVTVQDIAKWLKTDVDYVRKIVGICASLDKRTIVDDTLITEDYGFVKECEYDSLVNLMDDYIDYLVGRTKEEDFFCDIAHHLEKCSCEMQQEELVLLVKQCVTRLVRQIGIICDESKDYLLVVLEIADLGCLTKEEFLQLKTILICSEEEQEVKTATVVDALLEKEDG